MLAASSFSPSPLTSEAIMSDTQRSTPESESLVQIIRQKYGSRLNDAELEEVRQGIEGIMQAAAALRAVPLANSDEPVTVFSLYCRGV
jgi:hypothetical protein